MRSEESACRTCGAEYKNSYGFFIAIFLMLIAVVIGSGLWYYSKNQAKKEEILKVNINTYASTLKNIGFTENDANIIATLKYSNNTTLSKKGVNDLKGLVASYNDQRELSNKVMRVALAQPLSELQKIKRDVESRKYTGCLEAGKLIYVSSMGVSNDALLSFLADGNKNESEITALFTKSLLQEKEAERVLIECESDSLN